VVGAGPRPAAELDARCEATEAEGEVGLALHWQLEQRRLRRRLDGFLELDLPGAGTGAPCIPSSRSARTDPSPSPWRTAGLACTARSTASTPGHIGWSSSTTRPAGPGPARQTRSSAATPSAAPHLRPRRDLLGRPATTWWPSTGTSTTSTTGAAPARRRRPADPGPPVRGPRRHRRRHRRRAVRAPHPDEPDPWRRARCAYCDPDGADTATLWGQWQHKRRDPVLDGYRRLVDDVDDDEAGVRDDGAAP
jgi:hypothetical protein